MNPFRTHDIPAGQRRADAQEWRAFGLLAVLLAAEACLLSWAFGSWLLAINGKQWATFAALLAFGGLQSHVRRHSDDYGRVPVRWSLLAAQVVAFAGVFAVLRQLSAAAPPTAGWLPAAALAACLLWAACSIATIAPRLDLAAQLLGTAAGLTALAGAAWSAGNLTRTFWSYSGETTVRMVELLLRPLAGAPVVRRDPFVIGTEAFQVEIHDLCSGFHGIGLIVTLLAGYLWWFRGLHRFPQSLLLLPVGVLLMWLANVVRITALILVGIWISPAIAVDGFHSAAGWVAFLTVSLGLIWTAVRSPFFTVTGPVRTAFTPTRPIAAADAAAGEAPGIAAQTPGLSAVACLLPFLVLTATTLLTRAFTGGFDVLYPVRVLAVGGVLWRLRREFRWRNFSPSPLPVAIGLATFVLWMLLTRDAVGPGSPADATPTDDWRLDPMPLGQPWATAWLIFRTLGSTITVPIAEELFFRGFLMRRCISDDVDAVPIGTFNWFSFVLSSVAFGMLHGEAWIAGVVAGMMFAMALYARRRLFDAIVAHATTNALLSGYVIATGSWSHWG